MKKMIASFSLCLTAGLSTVFAANPDPNRQVLDVFKKEFATAQYVTWNKEDNLDKATFQLGANWVTAYFSTAGQLEGCVRDIFYDQLPLVVMTAVDKRFTDATIIEVREITNSEGTSYRVTLEKNTKKYKLKIDSFGQINQVDKLARK